MGEVLTWAFRVILLIMSVFLLLQKDYGWAINGFAFLFATFLPNVIARNLRISIPIWLQIWLFTAFSLHVLGGFADFYYIGIGYDHLTHALSASFIAALGYLLFRSIEGYSKSIYFPEKFLSILVLFFVMASGMVWEIIEFSVSLSLDITIQGSQEDTVVDILFNLVGGGIVALIHFTHMAWSDGERKSGDLAQPRL